MSYTRPKRHDARMSVQMGSPSPQWSGSTANLSPLPNPPVSGHPRVGGSIHRSTASLSTYLPSNPTASSSIVSLMSSMEPRKSIVHAYNVGAGGAEVQFLISLQDISKETSQAGEYQMSLTVKSGGIEQSLGGKETAIISMDPSKLKFHIFVFPKPSLPAGSLFCVRVWMEAGPNRVQHRVFSDDNLWVARDPPFGTIDHISFTRLAPIAPVLSDTYWSRVFRGSVGRASCNFFPSLTLLSHLDSVYTVALDYESGGVRRKIFDDVKLRLHCRLQDIHFIIYTVPLESSLPYSNHRLRVWIRGQNGTHMRLYKSDEFRLGASLDFDRLVRGPGQVAFAAQDAHSPSIAYYTSLLPNDPVSLPVSQEAAEDFPPAYSSTQS